MGAEGSRLLREKQQVDLSRKRFSSYPQGISATMLLSAPDGLPISKSSLKEAERKPMESVVFFRSGRINLTTSVSTHSHEIQAVAINHFYTIIK